MHLVEEKRETTKTEKITNVHLFMICLDWNKTNINDEAKQIHVLHTTS